MMLGRHRPANYLYNNRKKAQLKDSCYLTDAGIGMAMLWHGTGLLIGLVLAPDL